jgi:hypothetical protein
LFSGLEWEFPITEISQFIPQHMGMIMPLLLIIIGVLLAVLVIDSLTDVLLKIIDRVAGVQSPVSGGHIGAGTGDNLTLDSRGGYLDIDDFVDFDEYRNEEDDDREFY